MKTTTTQRNNGKDRLVTYGIITIDVKVEQCEVDSEGVLYSLFDVLIDELNEFLETQENATGKFKFVLSEE